MWKNKLNEKIIIINVKNDTIISTFDIQTLNLTKYKNYFIGKKLKSYNFDDNITIINYNGNENYDVLIEKVLHDVFHTLQKKINLNGNTYSANFLANDSSRIFLRLEWDYLFNALIEKNNDKKQCLIDTAEFFRNYRRNLYLGADTIENRFEIIEGTAQFTGFYLYSLMEKNRDSIFLSKIADFKEWLETSQDYTKNYGYLTGLLYCALLNQYSNDWTSNLNKNSDLCHLLLEYTKGKSIIFDIKNLLKLPKYQKIELSEKIIFKERNNKIIAIKKQYDNSSLLILPLEKAKIKFNPSTFLYIDLLGNYCPFFSISAEWGILEVKNGGIFSNDNHLIIPVSNIKIDKQTIKDNDNWELILSENYFLVKENNNYKIKINKTNN